MGTLKEGGIHAPQQAKLQRSEKVEPEVAGCWLPEGGCLPRGAKSRVFLLKGQALTKFPDERATRSRVNLIIAAIVVIVAVNVVVDDADVDHDDDNADDCRDFTGFRCILWTAAVL
eukprot:9378897-Pyramimonas_sp.AAC.2